MKQSLFIVLFLVILSACSGKTNTPLTAFISTSIPTLMTSTFKPSDLPISNQTSTATLIEADWKAMPIVPSVSSEMIAVFQRGLALGHDPSRFSKIGDCQNITTYFLAEFDDPHLYSLGSSYAYLQPTIDYFSGSWSRKSLAVHGGMNVAAVQDPFWTLTPKPKECNPGETPLACEIRVYNPSFVVISMEESWSGDIGKYDQYLRMIVRYVLGQNVVPILATRAEIPDPAISINATVARIAYDYHLPLWNFWAAANPLPSHGLTADGFHLTWAAPFFDDPQRMEQGWPWRNLTALQTLDAVSHGVGAQP